MTFNKERLAKFFAVWRVKFVDKLMSGANGLALGVTFLGFFGLTYTNVPYAAWALGIIPLTIGWAGLRSRPKFRVLPSDAVGKIIELEELESFLVVIPRVGLLGVHEVGKTTFLDAVLHRREPKRRTAKPYAVVVQLPGTGAPRFAAIIDSVGERYENQFRVMNTSNIVCLFLDHNATATDSTRARDRIRDEQNFIDQLVLARREAGRGADRAVVVENKEDLWRNDQRATTAMRRLSEHAAASMATISRAGGVISLRNFSNTRSEDVTNLLTEIRNVIGN